MRNKTNVIVFPALGHDINTIHPDFAKEAEYVRANGGEIILLDMEEISKGNVVAKGILDLRMARDYDHCAINEEDIQNYLTANGLESVAYDRECFFRLPEPITPDLYQLMRWKLGIQLVEAVMNTSDYSHALYASHNYLFQSLMGSKPGIPNQRQWWVGGQLVMTSSVSSPVFEPEEMSQYFAKRLTETVQSFNAKFLVVDIVRYANGKWAVGAAREGQTTPLPQNQDLSPLFSALINYKVT